MLPAFVALVLPSATIPARQLGALDRAPRGSEDYEEMGVRGAHTYQACMIQLLSAAHVNIMSREDGNCVP